MDFQKAYDEFIQYHFHARSGDAATRIAKGLQHAESQFVQHVWWPAFHNFRGLHPEYEIRDFKEGYRYIDFAYITPQFRIAIEIDGFGPHWKDITSEQFTDNCIRQNHLVIDKWNVLRFSFASVQSQPRMCQQAIQQLIGTLSGGSALSANSDYKTLKPLEESIVQLALNSAHSVTPADVMKRSKVNRDTARRHLKALVEMGWLVPATNKTRVHGYLLHPSRSGTKR